MLSRFQRPRRVVITGMGCVTPIGIGRKAFWAALLNGESGCRRIEAFDVSNSPVKIAAEVRDFDWKPTNPGIVTCSTNRTSRSGCRQEALEDANLIPAELRGPRRTIGIGWVRAAAVGVTEQQYSYVCRDKLQAKCYRLQIHTRRPFH